MTKYSTPQEEFWVGEFGSAYLERNVGEQFVASNLRLFADVLRRAPDVRSILELGCNIGLNLEALKRIDSGFALSGVEINAAAAEIARGKRIAEVIQGTIIEPLDLPKSDLTFTKTVLIHINPDALAGVYENLYRLSKKYIMVCEYHNPAPVVVSYRGHSDRLFKRDFAGELIERYGLRLVDYGFVYHRDRHFLIQDDMNWFLLAK